MRNAERGTRNGFATRCYANKDNLYDEKGILARNKNVLGLKKRASLDASQGKSKTSKGCCTDVLRPDGVLVLTWDGAKIARF